MNKTRVTYIQPFIEQNGRTLKPECLVDIVELVMMKEEHCEHHHSFTISNTSMPVKKGKQTNDVAFIYRSDKSGSARYKSNDDKIRFSCGSDISNIITIQR